MSSKLTSFYRYFLLLLCMCVFLGLSYHLGRPNLWRDESFTVNVAKQSFGRITQVNTQDFNPPLHMYLLHVWMMIFGDSEVAVRMPSVLFHLLTIVLSFWLGKAVFKKLPYQLLFTGFVATTPLLLYYATEARQYSMLVAFTTGALLCSVHLLRKFSFPWALGFILFAVLGLYTHTIFVLILASLFFWQLGVVVRRKHLTFQTVIQFFGMYAVIGFLFAPWLFELVGQLTHRVNEGTWLQFHPVEDVAQSVKQFFVSDRIDPNLTPFTQPIAKYVYLVGLGMTLIGIVCTKLKSREELFWPILLGLFLLSVIVISFKTPLYYIRYLIFVLPVIGILFTKGVEACNEKTQHKLCDILIVIVGLFLWGNLYLFVGNILQNPNLKSNYVDEMRYINAHWKQGDLILHSHAYTLHSFIYYSNHPGVLYDPPHKLPEYEGIAALSPRDYFHGNLMDYRRIWVPYHWADNDFDQVLINRHFRKIQQTSFAGDVSLDLWVQ